MNKKLPYYKYARALIAVAADSSQADTARRYLSLYRRRRVLRQGIGMAQAIAAEDNPLSEIGFTAPLSAAGAGSTIIERAAELSNVGLPIAIEKDERGRHRGTAIGDVADGLFAQTCQPYGDAAILDLYFAWMAGHPNMLHRHPESRFRRIPELLAKLRSLLDAAEADLRAAILSLARDVIFEVAIDGPLLAATLTDITGAVVLGFSGRHLRIASSNVPVLHGWGEGLACVNARDLRRLCIGADVVRIECGLFEWIGWRRGYERRHDYFAVDET